MGMQDRKERLDKERNNAEKDRKLKTYLFRVFVYLFAIAMISAMIYEYNKEPTQSDELPKFVMTCLNGTEQIFDNDSVIVCGQGNPLHTHTEPRIDNNIFGSP